MNLAVEIIPVANNSPSYQGRLTRPTNTKYHLETAEPNQTQIKAKCYT